MTEQHKQVNSPRYTNSRSGQVRCDVGPSLLMSLQRNGPSKTRWRTVEPNPQDTEAVQQHTTYGKDKSTLSRQLNIAIRHSPNPEEKSDSVSFKRYGVSWWLWTKQRPALDSHTHAKLN